MTTVFVTSFNHASLDGIAEIVELLGGELRRSGFDTILCRTLPETVNDGDLLIIIDEFSEPLVIEALENLKARRPKVTFVCVLTEFYSPGNWARPPSLNSFKKPWQSFLFDNLLYAGSFLNRRLKLFNKLKIRAPGPINYMLAVLGLIWLLILKARSPRTPFLGIRYFHERGYLWFRSLGLQSVSGIFDFYLALHPAIGTEAMATALGTSCEKIHTFLVPPPIVEKSRLINSKLEFGIDCSGSLSGYRKRQLKKIMRLLFRLSPGRRFAHHMQRGFDDSKMKFLLSYNPPQSGTWRYSSPMRIIGAIKRGQVPIVSEKFGDHPAEDLAISFPGNINEARLLVRDLVFERANYINPAWEKLQKYRAVTDENNRKIIRRLREINDGCRKM